jgi:hypothetical protein
MQRTILALTVGLMSLVASQSAQGALIAEWQFNSYSSGALSGYHPEYGSQSGAATADMAVPFHQTFASITGTTLNENVASSPNNNALQSTAGGGAGNPTLILHITGTGLGGFVLNYASESSSAMVQNWAYSTDGTTYTPFTTRTALTTWGALTVDFSTVTGLDGKADVYFRDIVTAGGNGSTIAFDNISISAVPEPVTAALGIFAGVFGVVIVARSKPVRRSVNRCWVGVNQWIDAV